MVCPALLPPAQRAHISTSDERISTSFPLPSSPHCAPSTTETMAIRVNIRRLHQEEGDELTTHIADYLRSISLPLRRSQALRGQSAKAVQKTVYLTTFFYHPEYAAPRSGYSTRFGADGIRFWNGGVPLEFSKPKCCQSVGQEASQRLWNTLSAAYGRSFVWVNYIYANALRSAWPESEDCMFLVFCIGFAFTLGSLWSLLGNKRRRAEIEER